jgi:hypothetical protein
MVDQATPNLPSRDFDVTIGFFGPLGFELADRDVHWMILERGSATLPTHSIQRAFWPESPKPRQVGPACTPYAWSLGADALGR